MGWPSLDGYAEGLPRKQAFWDIADEFGISEKHGATELACLQRGAAKAVGMRN